MRIWVRVCESKGVLGLISGITAKVEASVDSMVKVLLSVCNALS